MQRSIFAEFKLVRIALFSGNYNYLREGANRALNKLVGYLEREAGCTVRVYSPVTDTPAFEPEGTLVPVPSVTLPGRGEFQFALGLPRAIRGDLDSFDPQIVHVSTPDLLGVRAQSWALARAIPLVASKHTLFESYLEYYNLGLLRPLIDAHLRRFYMRPDHVLAPTHALAKELRKLRGDQSATVWSRGIERDLFSPDKRDMVWRRAQGIADDEIAVLFFGRLVLEKGSAIYKDVLSSLQSKHKVRPLIVGAGPAEKEFRQIDGAVLTGHLDGNRLARAVASADVMLTPSTTETFGQVVLEAMASGLPVVSADAPSARSLIEDGKTGSLCPPRSVPDYMKAIEALAGQPLARTRMGRAARAASAAYSWDAASESVARTYFGLVD